MKILLAKPRGFCAGVDRAIDIVKIALEIYDPPIYVRHQIVHNNKVVSNFEKLGVKFVDEISEIPENSRVIFSAHGVAPKVLKEAKKRNLKIIDATCPLVNKVHLEVKRYHQEGFDIILVGHVGHVEVEGTMGEAPGKIKLITNLEEVEKLEVDNLDKLVVLTQTTLSIEETRDITKALEAKYPKMILPPAGDICYATTNRQGAVKELARKSDLVLIVGSRLSSNSNRLVDTAKKQNKPAYLIDRFKDIDEKWLRNVNTVGISSGASVPDILVKEVIEYLKTKGATELEIIETIKENIKFGIPHELKKEAMSAKG